MITIYCYVFLQYPYSLLISNRRDKNEEKTNNSPVNTMMERESPYQQRIDIEGLYMSFEIDTSQVLEQLIITTQKEHIPKAEQLHLANSICIPTSERR